MVEELKYSTPKGFLPFHPWEARLSYDKLNKLLLRGARGLGEIADMGELARSVSATVPPSQEIHAQALGRRIATSFVEHWTRREAGVPGDNRVDGKNTTPLPLLGREVGFAGGSSQGGTFALANIDILPLNFKEIEKGASKRMGVESSTIPGIRTDRHRASQVGMPPSSSLHQWLHRLVFVDTRHDHGPNLVNHNGSCQGAWADWTRNCWQMA
jgi:hypothetical protein